MRMAILAPMALVLTACGGDPVPPTGTDFRELPADMVTVGMRYYSTEGDLRTAELRADTAYEFQDSAGAYHLRGLNLVVFDEATGERNATLTSLRGTFDKRTEGMVAMGEVVLVTVDGKRIETEELHYLPNSGRMWSDSLTVLIENGERTVGQRGFEATGVANGRIGRLEVKGPRGRFSGSVIF